MEGWGFSSGFALCHFFALCNFFLATGDGQDGGVPQPPGSLLGTAAGWALWRGKGSWGSTSDHVRKATVWPCSLNSPRKIFYCFSVVLEPVVSLPRVGKGGLLQAAAAPRSGKAEGSGHRHITPKWHLVTSAQRVSVLVSSPSLPDTTNLVSPKHAQTRWCFVETPRCYQISESRHFFPIPSIKEKKL